jgi:hypothetical protein
LQRMRRGGAVVFLRFIGRYAIATVMIPVGVALGVCGLIQFALRRRRARRDEAAGPGTSSVA